MKKVITEGIIIGIILAAAVILLILFTERQEAKTAVRLTADYKVAEDCTIVMRTDIGLYCRGTRSGKLFFVAK